jgi:hypothetical protein
LLFFFRLVIREGGPLIPFHHAMHLTPFDPQAHRNGTDPERGDSSVRPPVRHSFLFFLIAEPLRSGKWFPGAPPFSFATPRLSFHIHHTNMIISFRIYGCPVSSPVRSIDRCLRASPDRHRLDPPSRFPKAPPRAYSAYPPRTHRPRRELACLAGALSASTGPVPDSLQLDPPTLCTLGAVLAAASAPPL